MSTNALLWSPCKGAGVLPAAKREHDTISLGVHLFPSPCSDVGTEPSQCSSSSPIRLSTRKVNTQSSSPQRLKTTGIKKKKNSERRRKSAGTSLENFLESSPSKIAQDSDSAEQLSSSIGRRQHQKSQESQGVSSSEQNGAILCCSNQMHRQLDRDDHAHTETVKSPETNGKNQNMSNCTQRKTMTRISVRARRHHPSTSQFMSPRKPESILETNVLSQNHNVNERTSPKLSPSRHSSSPALTAISSTDHIPVKPSRIPSNGSKTQNAIFRPKTPEKRSVKKGLVLRPKIRSTVSSPAATMNVLAISPNAQSNLYVNVVSPVYKDAANQSPNPSNQNMFIRQVQGIDLSVVSQAENDSSSSLKITDILSDQPKNITEMSLPDLLGRCIQHTTSNDNSRSALFDDDGESETIWTEETVTPLCQDRWHSSTPCLTSSDFLSQHASLRRLQMSLINDASTSRNNNSSSSELFMPTKPRRQKSRQN